MDVFEPVAQIRLQATLARNPSDLLLELDKAEDGWNAQGRISLRSDWTTVIFPAVFEGYHLANFADELDSLQMLHREAAELRNWNTRIVLRVTWTDDKHGSLQIAGEYQELLWDRVPPGEHPLGTLLPTAFDLRFAGFEIGQTSVTQVVQSLNEYIKISGIDTRRQQ